MTHCLVVDDDLAIRTLLQSFLEQHGLQVETLADGAALRRQLPQGGVDVLVLDLMAPDDNGLSLCQWPKQLQPALPVIMLTAQGDPVSRVLTTTTVTRPPRRSALRSEPHSGSRIFASWPCTRQRCGRIMQVMKRATVPLLRSVAATVLLGGFAAAAQARVNWSIGVDLGQPYLTTLPQGAVSVQIGGGHGRYWRHGGHWYRPWYSHGGGVGWVVVAPPVVYPLQQQIVAAPDPALPTAPSRPDPVIYPRNGQDAQRTEFDRQDCNRWATTQPAALADAAVFHRAVEACMDGRGYTMK